MSFSNSRDRSENEQKDILYLDGEEKFGRLSSRIYSAFSGLYRWKMYRQISEDIVKQSPSSILDIGCGPGDLLIGLATDLSSSTLAGVDPSPSMVRLARKKIRSRRLTDRISIVTGSSRKLNLDRKFSMIISTFSFHHWIKKEKSLKNVLQHVLPGGKMTIYDLNLSGFYGHVPFAKHHGLNPDYAKSLEFPGFRTEVSFSSDSKLVFLSFIAN